MSLILVVEDDLAILEGLKDNLEFDAHEVVTATDGAEGYRLMRERRPDLVILDVMLPRMNGYDLCRRARRNGIETPILMLTARSDEMDRVMGLDIGADDYVTKPFSMSELLARIRAILRRVHVPESHELRFGDVEINFSTYEAAKGGEPVQLAPKEFGVIRYLSEREGHVVKREELMDAVWEYDHFPTTRTVDNHIASLRAKLEDNSSDPQHLLTVHRVGYKFVGDS